MVRSADLSPLFGCGLKSALRTTTTNIIALNRAGTISLVIVDGKLAIGLANSGLLDEKLHKSLMREENSFLTQKNAEIFLNGL